MSVLCSSGKQPDSYGVAEGPGSWGAHTQRNVNQAHISSSSLVSTRVRPGRVACKMSDDLLSRNAVLPSVDRIGPHWRGGAPTSDCVMSLGRHCTAIWHITSGLLDLGICYAKLPDPVQP